MRVVVYLFIFSMLSPVLIEPICCNIFLAGLLASHLRSNFRLNLLESDVSRLKESVMAMEVVSGMPSSITDNLLPSQPDEKLCSKNNSSFKPVVDILDWLHTKGVTPARLTESHTNGGPTLHQNVNTGHSYAAARAP